MSKHGMCDTPTYRSWNAMKNRCNNPNIKNSKYWGGKGITYDPKWETFEGFYEDMGDRPEGTSLDREHSDQNYCKANCRWATPKVQNRHNRNEIEFNGQIRSIREWAAVTGIKERTLWMRLFHSKWSVQRALTTPHR